MFQLVYVPCCFSQAAPAPEEQEEDDPRDEEIRRLRLEFQNSTVRVLEADEKRAELQQESHALLRQRLRAAETAVERQQIMSEFAQQLGQVAAAAPEEENADEAVDGRIEAICGELNIDSDTLLTQEQVEDIYRCDDGSEYAGDDYMINIGWRWNEFIQRWIDRDDLEVASNVFENWGAEQFAAVAAPAPEEETTSSEDNAEARV